MVTWDKRNSLLLFILLLHERHKKIGPDSSSSAKTHQYVYQKRKAGIKQMHLVHTTSGPEPWSAGHYNQMVFA
jgi:hypothetical protein